MKTKQAQFWEGSEGERYINRNSTMGTRYEDRKPFFDLFDSIDKDAAILEAGCNIGLNLQILEDLGFTNLYGVDIGKKAIDIAKLNYPEVEFYHSDLAELPFQDSEFDVVFTSGVLIHFDPANALNVAMKEIYRCSKSLILGFEDYDNKFVSKAYTGKQSFYWKGPFVKRWQELFPELSLEKTGSIKHDQALSRAFYKFSK